LKERSLNILKLLDKYIGIPAVLALAAVNRIVSTLIPSRPVEVKTIVMAKLWGVGNLVMIMPLIQAVRKRFPRAGIYFLTLECNADLLLNLPEIDGIVTLRTRSAAATVRSIAEIPYRLAKLKPDLFLDFEQFLRITPIWGFLSGASQRVGLSTPGQARDFLYNTRVPYLLNRHMTLTFGDVVRSAGADTTGFPSLQVPRLPEAAARVEEFLSTDVPGDSALVAIHPGSGDNFPARRWPVDEFARAAVKIHRETGARIVLTGTKPERFLAERFGTVCPVPFTNTMGRFDLAELIELLARADLLISNDTAPVHIASALGTPLVALYGPNTPDLYGPLHRNARAFYLRFPCSPCITNFNAKTSNCRVPSCILGIDAEKVARAGLDLLSRTGRTKREREKAVLL